MNSFMHIKRRNTWALMVKGTNNGILAFAHPSTPPVSKQTEGLELT